MIEKLHSDMKSFNDHIFAVIKKPTDISSNTDKQEEQLTDISSKVSTYEYRLEKPNMK